MYKSTCFDCGKQYDNFHTHYCAGHAPYKGVTPNVKNKPIDNSFKVCPVCKWGYTYEKDHDCKANKSTENCPLCKFEKFHACIKEYEEFDIADMLSEYGKDGHDVIFIVAIYNMLIQKGFSITEAKFIIGTISWATL